MRLAYINFNRELKYVDFEYREALIKEKNFIVGLVDESKIYAINSPNVDMFSVREIFAMSDRFLLSSVKNADFFEGDRLIDLTDCTYCETSLFSSCLNGNDIVLPFFMFRKIDGSQFTENIRFELQPAGSEAFYTFDQLVTKADIEAIYTVGTDELYLYGWGGVVYNKGVKPYLDGVLDYSVTVQKIIDATVIYFEIQV